MDRSLFAEAGVRLRLAQSLFGFSCLKYRDSDGFIASTKQSGNHWIRHLLGTVIARRYELPEQAHIGETRLVGKPQSRRVHAGIPRIVQSHKVCSPLVHNVAFRRVLRFPRYVILVRDLRAILVSHYERWKDIYQVPFSDYLRGGRRGKRFDYDLWDAIAFLNSWSSMQRRIPDLATVLRYEDMQVDAAREAERVWRFLGLPDVASSEFRAAAEASTKDRMKAKEPGAAKTGTIIRLNARNPENWYAPADREFFIAACARHLQHDFGYDYSRFESALPDARSIPAAA
ncbi:MAG: sulfotransferase domain-containing protein [Planctomyces sp.]|nr:sulfotransferase domain-containing protein [Planctomyces sp.]